eukprot:GHVO01034663.1.p1 GENE.GHVO01034663.1~~GHVO01034663.1.p1  ORF type:complete len:545 (+),score=88.39 GHVO01034663.1:94-1635(+)
MDILRCLILTWSGPLFQPYNQLSHSCEWINEFVQGDIPFTANFFCSLMSTVFSYDPVGFGIPYGRIVSSGKGNQEYTEACVHTLCLLLDAPGDPPKNANPQLPQTSNNNVYRNMLTGISNDAELQMIIDGFIRMLSTCPSSKNTLLPSSALRISFEEELLALLWHCLRHNPHFLKKVVSSPSDSNKLLVPILFLLVESYPKDGPDGKDQKTRQAVAYMCTFLLVLLSGQREFAVSLNAPYTEKFPLDIPLFQGNHADLLTIAIHRVLIENVQPQNINESLAEMFMTVLANISGYVKSYCLESSVKLLSIFDRLSRPRWIMAGPYRYQALFLAFDTINNIVQYHYEGNAKLVYSILRQKELFWDLQNMAFNLKHAPKSPDAIDEGRKSPVPFARPDGVDANAPWKPSEAWFEDWKGRVPDQVVLRLIDSLLSQVETECQEKGLIDQSEVIKYLQTTIVVGLLPVPHPIVIRHFEETPSTTKWITSFIWGSIFSKCQGLPLFDWNTIKLLSFGVA